MIMEEKRSLISKRAIDFISQERTSQEYDRNAGECQKIRISPIMTPMQADFLFFFSFSSSGTWH